MAEAPEAQAGAQSCPPSCTPRHLHTHQMAAQEDEVTSPGDGAGASGGNLLPAFPPSLDECLRYGLKLPRSMKKSDANQIPDVDRILSRWAAKAPPAVLDGADAEEERLLSLLSRRYRSVEEMFITGNWTGAAAEGDNPINALRAPEAGVVATVAACGICTCEFENGDKVSGLSVCQHVFHRKCILFWMQRQTRLTDVATCPFCRAEIRGS